MIVARAIDGTDKTVPVCAYGGALMTQGLLDGMVHGGFAFMATNQIDLGSGNVASLTFTVAGAPTPGHVHATYKVICEAESEVAFYEGVVRTVNTGTAVTPICLNRNEPKVSAWGSDSVYKNATINIVGATLLDVEVVGSKKAEGGRSEAMFDWIVGRGKTYSIVVTDQSGQANETTIRLVWGRHVEVI